VNARFFRLVTTDPTYIARIDLHAGPRLVDWPAKTNYAGAIRALRLSMKDLILRWPSTRRR